MDGSVLYIITITSLGEVSETHESTLYDKVTKGVYLHRCCIHLFCCDISYIHQCSVRTYKAAY